MARSLGQVYKQAFASFYAAPATATAIKLLKSHLTISPQHSWQRNEIVVAAIDVVYSNVISAHLLTADFYSALIRAYKSCGNQQR